MVPGVCGAEGDCDAAGGVALGGRLGSVLGVEELACVGEEEADCVGGKEPA